MIKVITDSASDIVDHQREDLVILPVTITFGEEQFQDDCCHAVVETVGNLAERQACSGGI